MGDALPAQCRVFSFHSTKGGTGKTTLALHLASHLARNTSGQEGQRTCFIEADLTGASVARFMEFGPSSARQTVVRVLLSDPTCDVHLPASELWTIPVRDTDRRLLALPSATRTKLDADTSEHVARVLLRYIYLEGDTEYAADRLWQLIHHLATAEEGPITCFVVDHSPGLHSLSRTFFEKMIESGSKAATQWSSHVAMVVATVDAPDLHETCERLRQLVRSTGSSPLRHPGLMLLLNRVPADMDPGGIDVGIDDILLVRGVTFCAVDEELAPGNPNAQLRGLLADGGGPGGLRTDAASLNILYESLGV